MARYFDVTAVTTSIELDAKRSGQAAFTVTNATAASIRGDAVVVSEPGAEVAKYEIDEPSRQFGPGATDQVTIKVTAPVEMPAGTYGFRLRMLLGGGIPEEQFDDGPTVQYSVAKVDAPPPKPKFPWWILVVVALIALVVIGGIAYVATREPTPTPTPIPTPSPTPTPTPTPPPPTEPAPIVSERALVIQANDKVDLDTGLLNSREPDLSFTLAGGGGVMTTLGNVGIADAGGSPPGRQACSTMAMTPNQIELLALPSGRYFCVRTSENNISEIRLTERIDRLTADVFLQVLTWPGD